MAALKDPLRGLFEKEIIRARDAAETAAQAALVTLAVEQDRPFESLSEEQRALRRSLRARARQLGEGDMGAGMPLLVEEIAYEQWHRMLFTRFLAENELLMHPQGVAVTLEECAELAQEEGAEDLWAVATRYAGLMLPGLFRVDDPALQVRFAREGRHRLEQSVSDLPSAVFTSDDGLGWAYQFWQSKKKDEVNASERKIGGADIAPVTQLFTEDYMVKFLLHNTLGAWWAHRHPDSPLNKTFEYLRFRDDGTPAAGTFDGWPDSVAEVTMMDPCGGSGHFVVAAFEMFTCMRMEEEGLSATEAGDAVIRDNVHMLELDLRCTQIASFNLSLAAWKSGGYRELPPSNIACSGIPVQGQLEEWTKLAGVDEALKWTLERLHYLFRNAPDLGSLINPVEIPHDARMFIKDYERVLAILDNLSADEGSNNIGYQDALSAKAIADLAKSTRLLSKSYLLVVTNVPYLGQKKQSDFLKNFLKEEYPETKSDLATVFIQRCQKFTREKGSYGLVVPQNWLYLRTYTRFRKQMLEHQTWNHLCRLGSGAFETISGEVVNVALGVFTNLEPDIDIVISGLDATTPSTPKEKSSAIMNMPLLHIRQDLQLRNDLCVIVLEELAVETKLSDFVTVHYGSKPGQTSRVTRYFWELEQIIGITWVFMESTPNGVAAYDGKSKICLSIEQINKQGIDQFGIRGSAAWGKRGIIVSKMNKLPSSIYCGEFYDDNTYTLIPESSDLLAPIFHYVRSSEYLREVRKRNQKLAIDTTSMINVPFDLSQWSVVAKEENPLPEPFSNEPTEWLFAGRLNGSTDPLQVSVARLLGYIWPKQEADRLFDLADEDGIVCLSSIVGESPAVERLRALLASAYGEEWSLEIQRKLLVDVGFKGKRLDVWLRDGFFKQHCKLFENRPFIWHIWDGRKDGFSALVNYHKLDYARLERLIYTYLGDWINTQKAELEQGVAGAEGRLVAALELKKKLELILEGEPPYDVYVRWKPLHEQPIGWNPDLNDGVRLNIRPFVTAGVLRSKFTVHWKKDRGKNPDGSERINDLHFTRAEKEAARTRANT